MLKESDRKRLGNLLFHSGQGRTQRLILDSYLFVDALVEWGFISKSNTSALIEVLKGVEGMVPIQNLLQKYQEFVANKKI